MGRIILLILLAGLSGCTLFGPTIEYVPTKIPIVCDSAEYPAQLTMLPVHWQNATNAEGRGVLGLDGRNYSNLSINIADIKAYIQKQRNLVQYYERCIERHNEKGPQ